MFDFPCGGSARRDFYFFISSDSKLIYAALTYNVISTGSRLQKPTLTHCQLLPAEKIMQNSNEFFAIIFA